MKWPGPLRPMYKNNSTDHFFHHGEKLMKGTINRCTAACLTILFVTLTAIAAHADELAQANNPLAHMKSVALQNYYMGDVTESDKALNQFWFRYAQPVDRWLIRASLPVNTFPTPPDGNTDTGLGDFNVFAAYLLDIDKPGVTFGIGPQVTLPTNTQEGLGTDKWSAGFANVLFNAESKLFQYGYLLTWQTSFAGPGDEPYVNAGALQPFAFLQLGSGWYLRAVPIWMYNFQNDSYNIPLGVGIGKVIISGNKVFNMYLEPQFSVAHDGPGQAEWQVLCGFNIQFKE